MRSQINDVSSKIVRYVPYIFCCSVGIPILIVKFTIKIISTSRRKSTNGFFTIVPGYLRDIIFFFNSVFSGSTSQCFLFLFFTVGTSIKGGIL